MFILLYRGKHQTADIWWPARAEPYKDKADAVKELAKRRVKYEGSYEFKIAQFTED